MSKLAANRTKNSDQMLKENWEFNRASSDTHAPRINHDALSVFYKPVSPVMPAVLQNSF